MKFEMSQLAPADRYKLLTSLVTPRPIAWVTTVHTNGSTNAAPFSFFNVFGSNPPILALAPGNRPDGNPKDTAANIRRTGEFVVHMVDEVQAEAMVATAAAMAPGESETEAGDLATIPSSVVKPPRLRDTSVAMECVEHTTLQIGQNRLIIGQVLMIHVADHVIDPETLYIHDSQYHPVGRMHGPDGYCQTRDLFQLERPQ